MKYLKTYEGLFVEHNEGLISDLVDDDKYCEIVEELKELSNKYDDESNKRRKELLKLKKKRVKEVTKKNK